ncbi:formylglycine-generating enzyme family protein [Flagellimonas halotolerans]|uniref:Formylglycine-generating enzyme family protein n=1 Tax=Flagellimonas halotolerans TaxID=3112164 RepID=A0ABU6IR74_9FLAO|nr:MULTISPECIES: formylglycine-generating enzyme family protein [unclassified Allomuricauda]MEC3965731.1 formylglycine-generating enzyme family protein [Muricauda sp. SYSU M86414]MEC4265598.1 formylglycine-generating enzyme family protein [Muricauda sp. SYSU M84420]
MNSNITILKTICSILGGIAMCFGQDRSNYAEHLPGTTATVEMIAIPSGTFQMGSPQNEPGRKPDEGPVREIEMNGFWMSKLEITWELYNLFVERAIDDLDNEKRAGDVQWDTDAVSGATTPYVDMSLGMGREEGFPAVNITQRAASTFCEWLSSITGHYYRLPTEAEWEYAARAGNNTPYHFGTDAAQLEEFAWFNENSNGRYHEVGSKEPNPWGLHDMYGNVAEWTLDQYNKNGYADAEMPFEPPTNEYPISIRGGSFRDGAQELRSASRLASDPVWKQRDPQFPRSKWWFTDAGFVGFRIVRPYATPKKEEFENYWIKDQY